MFFDEVSIKRKKILIKGILEYDFLMLKMKYRNYTDDMKFHVETSGHYTFFGKWKTKTKVLKSRHFNIDVVYDELSDTDKFNNSFTLKIGDKVIHKTDRSDEGFGVVKVVGFDDLKGKYAGSSSCLPIIEMPNGAHHVTFGIVIPYNEELATLLRALNPTEQWNLLCRDHCQKSGGDEYPLDSKLVPLQWYKKNAQRMLYV
jgi:hypothetical protein